MPQTKSRPECHGSLRRSSSTHARPPDPIADLWTRYRRLKNERLKTAVRNAIAEHWLPLVDQLAVRMAKRLPDSITAEELASNGAEALLRAIPLYHASHGASQKTYFSRRIWGAMQDHLRSIDPLRRSTRSRLKIVARLAVQLSREPTDEEIADACGVPPDKAAQYRTERTCMSLDSGGFANCTLHNSLSAAVDPTKEQREQIVDLLKGCSSREKILIYRYYIDGLTMAEVATELGISESRVSQIHTDLIARLRARHSTAIADCSVGQELDS